MLESLRKLETDSSWFLISPAKQGIGTKKQTPMLNSLKTPSFKLPFPLAIDDKQALRS